MAIQSSINSLLSQAQSLAAFYTGFKKADDIIKDTTAARGEAQIQTDIAAGNAPMKDGKADPEWLKKRRDEMFNLYGNLSARCKHQARVLKFIAERGVILEKDMEVRNEIASDLARASVEARTASINKTKSNFDEHTASLIKYYSKGSGNP